MGVIDGNVEFFIGEVILMDVIVWIVGVMVNLIVVCGGDFLVEECGCI